jgi:hypothetical protein
LPLLAELLAPKSAWEASVSQNLTITVTAATQSVSFSPTALTFPPQGVDTPSAAQTVTMTNSGNTSFPLSSIATTGANAGDFAETNNCPSSLAVTANCRISVTFTPTATGPRTASVVATATGGGTYSVSLSGSGVSAFFVATNGSDGNNGLSPINQGGAAGPFATLGKCQSAMQASSTVKTCYIRAGTYSLTASSGSDYCSLNQGNQILHFTSSDSGETWSYYPPDGVNSAILDGGSSSGTTGLGAFGCDDGATSLTVTGLTFQHFRGWAVYATQPITFTNNIFHDNYGPTGTAAVNIEGANGSLISHNYVYNVQGFGILVQATATQTMNNTTITNNVVINSCTAVADCGGIYTEDNNTTTASTNIVIEYNYVRDVYAAGGGQGGNSLGNCIYLDAGASNTAVEYNICTGIWSSPAFMHAGSNNVWKYNIFDMPTGTNPTIVYYQALAGYPGSAMTGNVFQNNIVVGNVAGQGIYPNGSGFGRLNFQNNGYYKYSGGTMNYTCLGGATYNQCTPNANQDANPTSANPLITCWGAKLASNSPMLSSPVNYPSQPENWDTPGFWGPPGFVIPKDARNGGIGTAPSWSTSGCTD